MALPNKRKIEPTTLSMMAGNVSTAFPESHLSALANLSNHFLRVLLSFGEEPPVPPPPSKSPMTESTIVATSAKRAESVEIIVIICSQIKL